jgi:hypothetical protein
MKSFKNTKKQGDMGLGAAIFYFTKIGQTVSIPLTDSQDYDLIFDDNISLSRVQVKSCSFKRKYYEVNLSVKGGNRSNKGSLKKFDNSNCDFLFVLTENSDKYLIPTKDLVAKCNLVLGPKYKKYLLK